MSERTSERTLVEEGEIKASQGEGVNVAEGGEFVRNAGESIRHEPFELVGLSEVQIANVTAAGPQAVI